MFRDHCNEPNATPIRSSFLTLALLNVCFSLIYAFFFALLYVVLRCLMFHDPGLFCCIVLVFVLNYTVLLLPCLALCNCCFPPVRMSDRSMCLPDGLPDKCKTFALIRLQHERLSAEV